MITAIFHDKSDRNMKTLYNGAYREIKNVKKDVELLKQFYKLGTQRYTPQHVEYKADLGRYIPQSTGKLLFFNTFRFLSVV